MPTHATARTIAASAAVASLLLLALGVTAAIDPLLARAGAVTLFTIGLLATGVLPEYLTAVLFFLFAMLLDVAPAAVVFSGFTSSAVWLIFSGLVIGCAVRRTGLGERMARALVRRTGRRYGAVVASAIALPALMAFLMPSSLSRAVLLLPIIAALADTLGYRAGSRGRTGIVMAAGLACFVPAGAILPATVPNMVLVGAAESGFGFQFSYFRFLLVHFPVMTVLHSVLIGVLATRMFGEPPAALDDAAPAPPALNAAGRDQRLLMLVLALALAGWVSDFAHGISPAWIGLAAAAVLLMPPFGPVPRKAFTSEINWSPLFYVGAVLGLAAVVRHSGVADVIETVVLGVAPLTPGAEAQNFGLLVGLASLTGFVTTMAGTPAVLTPLAPELAQASGLSLEAVLMTQVVGYSILFLPYQSPPLVVAMQLGGVRIAEGIGFTVVQALLAWLLLVPLHYAWWRFIGLLG